MKRQVLIDILNEWSEGQLSSIRFKKNDTMSHVIEICLPDPFLDYASLSLKEEFYNELKRVLLENGIPEPTFNNTGSVFWSYSENKMQITD